MNLSEKAMSTPVVGQPIDSGGSEMPPSKDSSLPRAIEPDQIREGMTVEARKEFNIEGDYRVIGGVVRAIPGGSRLAVLSEEIGRLIAEGYVFTLLADVPRPDWRDAPAGSLWKDPEAGEYYMRFADERTVDFTGVSGASGLLISGYTADDEILARLVPVPGFVYDNGEWREGR